MQSLKTKRLPLKPAEPKLSSGQKGPTQKRTTLMDITQTTNNSMKQDECVQSNYKEIASKVVDLQRQVMNLRAKLKLKETVEQENEKLKEELGDLRSKAVANEKKKNKYKDQIKELE